MSNKIFGYARVSTSKQDTAVQINALLKEGVLKENIFEDKVSGKSTSNRPSLKILLETASSGDAIICYKTDRFARSTSDLYKLMETLEQKGVKYRSITEPALNTTTPQGKLVFGILAVIADFERSLNNQRVRDGLAVAREMGKKGGRPYKTNEEQEKLIVKLYQDGEAIKDLISSFNIKKSTVYRVLKRYNVPLRYIDNVGMNEVIPQNIVSRGLLR